MKQEHRVKLELREHKDLKVYKVFKEFKVYKVYKEFKVTLELEQKDKKVLLVPKEQLEIIQE